MFNVRHLIAFTTLATLLSAPAISAAADVIDAAQRLRQLENQYRQLRTFHCLVSTTHDYKTIPPGIFHVEGTQEYWADGGKYRILQLENTPMFPGLSHDVRWDGEQFQWFNVADGTLIVSRRSKQKTPYIAEPFPLLPLSFLNPSGDDLSVKLSLTDLSGDMNPSQFSEAQLTGNNGREITLPGGTLGNTQFIFRIGFDTTPSFLPTLIRRISSDGVDLSTTEITYRPIQSGSGTVYLPCAATITNRTSANRVFAVATYKLISIDVDLPVMPETFTLDFQTAKHVIDIDRTIPATTSAAIQFNASSHFGNTRATQSLLQTSSGAPCVAMIEAKDFDDLSDRQFPISTLIFLIVGLGALFTGLALLLHRNPSGEASR